MNTLSAALHEMLAAVAEFAARDVRWWLLCLVLPFMGTLLLVPWLVVRLPADYFQPDRRKLLGWGHAHPLLRIVLIASKNLAGILLLLMGLAMLVLPGQGLLTMLAGLMLLDFPGKYRWERWLVTRKPVWRSVNWLRIKQGQAPFEL